MFLDDGRAEIDANVVEHAIRPLALTRKNALLAGSDGGAEPWAVIASLVETCKLTGVEPQAYLADVIYCIVAGHPQSRLDGLLPWVYPTTPTLKAHAHPQSCGRITALTLVVETIAKIGRAFFIHKKPTRAICREPRLSRKVVRSGLP